MTRYNGDEDLTRLYTGKVRDSRGDDGRDWRIVYLLGDSQIMGFGNLKEYEVMYPFELGHIPHTFIWDQYAYPDRLLPQQNPGIRSLSEGYGGYCNRPWETGTLGIGMEWSLGHCLKQWTRENTLIVKLGVGGSGATPYRSDYNWHYSTEAPDSLIQIFKELYIDPAERELLERINGDSSRIIHRQFISMLGTNDMQPDEAAEGYGIAMEMLIDDLRLHVAPEHPDSLPWLILETPPYETQKGVLFAGVKEIINSQRSLAKRINVYSQALERPGFLSDRVHLSAEGLVRAGQQAAKWCVKCGMN